VRENKGAVDRSDWRVVYAVSVRRRLYQNPARSLNTSPAAFGLLRTARSSRSSVSVVNGISLSTLSQLPPEDAQEDDHDNDPGDEHRADNIG